MEHLAVKETDISLRSLVENKMGQFMGLEESEFWSYIHQVARIMA